MNNLTGMPFEYNDDNNDNKTKKMKELWGESWKKLNPKQKQLVREILSNLN